MDDLHTLAPGSVELTQSLVEGYQPYSRINEIVHNAFIDPHEWNQLLDRPLTKLELDSKNVYELLRIRSLYISKTIPEHISASLQDARPNFHEWATVLPGYICVMRKMRDKNWRGFLSAETAAPVIACSAGMPKAMDDQFFFAGIARSKSIKVADDGRGPTTDDHFTMHIGGVATILNNGRTSVHPGDGVAWTFEASMNNLAQSFQMKKARTGPRRIQIVRVAPSCFHPRTFGRCVSFAKPGETFDVLIGPTST
tara:strand:+ start:1210 stop:1971 length:762 start_codon:yes stop_codon:yes gene_type:complete